MSNQVLRKKQSLLKGKQIILILLLKGVEVKVQQGTRERDPRCSYWSTEITALKIACLFFPLISNQRKFALQHSNVKSQKAQFLVYPIFKF